MHRFGRCVAYTHKSRPVFGHTGVTVRQNQGVRNRLTTSCLYLESSKSKSPPTIRWYKQLYDGAFKRERLDPQIEDADEDSAEAALLRRKLTKLEEELEELSGKGCSTIEPLLRDLSEEDREKVREALRQSKDEEVDQPPTDEETSMVDYAFKKLLPEEAMEGVRSSQNDALLGDLMDQMDLLPDEYLCICRFNRDLGHAADEPSDHKRRKQVWMSFLRSRKKVPQILRFLPDAAWDVLWISQAESLLHAPERAERLILLSYDMVNSGKELTYLRKIEFIESLLLKGRHTEATDYWQSQLSVVKKKEPTSRAFELLGVRLYAAQGNPRKAQQIALDILVQGDKDTSQTLVPVIDSWIHSGGELGTKHAWAVYLHLRAELKSDMKPEDYDRISMGFLRAGRTDLALAIFKDVMLSGERTEYETTDLYKTSIGLVGGLQSNSVDLAELTKISLTALTILPRKFQNKYFYGSWMKRLIGMGETDAAAMVLELMYERNVKPDARHLNGIIGAWQRSGHPQNEKKAEQLGWAMIHERINFVSKREGEAIEVGATHAGVKDAVEIHAHQYVKRAVCPATIETFSLLLLDYERRGLTKYVKLLCVYLSRAKISPNTYFMNHLLYAELRRGKHDEARKLYLTMSRSVQPDLETFAALWDCEKQHLNKLSMYASDRFPGPRRLFSEMMTWYSTIGTKSRNEAHEIFSKDLYDQVVRCMCLSRDLEGTLVALYALKESFNFFPDPDVARMVTLQVASMGKGEPKTPGRRRSRLSDNTQHKANIARIARVLQLIIDERARTLAERGIKINAAGQLEEQLYLLAEFLRTILRRFALDESTVEQGIEKAAWDMGVSGIRMLDPHIRSSK